MFLKQLFRLLIAFICVLASYNAQATHIVGGDLVYQYLGNNNYHVTITMYRDCYNGTADFDVTANMGVFDSAGTYIQTIQLAYKGKTTVTPTSGSPCLSVPTTGICYEVTHYDTVLNLPYLSGGYQLLYQRCCRNSTIQNIANPGNVGASFYTRIPDMHRWQYNSSPQFKNNAPTFICIDEPLSFDHSATDADGDSLVYDICTPYDGGSPANAAPTVPTLPLNYLAYNPPYSAGNVMNTSPPLSINRKTGYITVTPSTQGQFVFAVCVREYRNGQYLGETRREIQINTRPCTKIIVSTVKSADYVCGSTTATFANLSSGSDFYSWNFGDPLSTVNNVTTQKNPIHKFSGFGTYTVRLTAFSSALPSCSDTSYKTIHLVSTLLPDFSTSFSDCITTTNLLFTNSTQENVPGAYTYFWNFGDGSTSTNKNPTHTYASANGTYTVTLIATVAGTCNDTKIKVVDLKKQKFVNAGNDEAICFGDSVNIGAASQSNFTYSWTPATGLNSITTANPTASPTISTTYILTGTETTHGCQQKDTVIVRVNSLPVAKAGTDMAICKGEQISIGDITTVDPKSTYEWLPTDGLSTPNMVTTIAIPSFTTTYILKVTNQYGCIATNGITISVFTIDEPVPTAYKLCKGSAVQLNDTANQNYGYNWLPATGLDNSKISSPTASPVVTTTYTVTISQSLQGGHVCNVIKSTVVNVSAQTLNVKTNKEILFCEGVPLTFTASSNAANTQYKWSSRYNFTDSLNNAPKDSAFTLTPAKNNGFYYVEAYNQYCISKSTVKYTADTVSVKIPLVETCAGVEDTIQIVSNTLPHLKFKWNKSPSIIGTDTSAKVIVKTYTNIILYATATTPDGCEKTFSVPVQLKAAPESHIAAPKHAIVNGEILSIQASPQGGNYQYQWVSVPENGVLPPSPNIQVSPTITTTYYLLVSDVQSTGKCSGIDTIVITVHPFFGCDPVHVFVPDGFTPNNDGNNDVLYVRSNAIGNIELLIFNRWGETVAEIRNQSVGWDGTYNGSPAPPGVYVYYLRYTCLVDNLPYTKKGNITLIR